MEKAGVTRRIAEMTVMAKNLGLPAQDSLVLLQGATFLSYLNSLSLSILV